MEDFIEGKTNDRKIRTRVINIMLFMVFGVMFNVVCSYLSKVFEWGLYLDTIGTMLNAAILGYFPGVLVGFFTNVIMVIFKSSEIYYGAVNMTIAVVVAYSKNKGYLKSKSKSIVIAILIILVSSLISSEITWLIKYSYVDINNVTQQVIKGANGTFILRLMDALKTEIGDKTISVLVATLIYILIPEKIKGKLNITGLWKDRIGGGASWDNIKKQKIRVQSLKSKMVMFSLAGGFLIALSATIISIILFREFAINEHVKEATGVINLVKMEYDPEKIDYYIEYGFDADDYKEMIDKFYKIKSSHEDIKYLYSYKIYKDGCITVFDLDIEGDEGYKPGEFVEFDEAMEENIEYFLAGEEVPPIITNDSYGFLFTIFEPIYNSEGECVCYIGIDYSMEAVNQYVRIFLMRELSLLIVFFILVIAVGLTFVEHNIVLPVNAMSFFVENFAYDTEEAREKNVSNLKKLNIRTGDEIENIFKAFLKTTEDSMHYEENLKKANVLVEDMKEHVYIADEIARKDALTGVKNKVAYDEYTYILDKYFLGVDNKNEINENGSAYKSIKNTFLNSEDKKFAILMLDLNYLKKINDKYGHRCGDIYIVNFINLLKEVFETDNIFRIGGDEFVIIVEPSKSGNCERLVKQFNKKCEKLRDDGELDAWEKISAAIGIAYYDEEKDKNCDDVFKRADLLMYKNKIRMKGQRK